MTWNHRNAVLCWWKSDLYRNRDFWRWVFKVFKRSRKPNAGKSRFENVRFFSWRAFFVGTEYDIQSTNEIAFKRTVRNFTRVFDFPPSDLMSPRYCHQRMRACACKMPFCSLLVLDPVKFVRYFHILLSFTFNDLSSFSCNYRIFIHYFLFTL